MRLGNCIITIKTLKNVEKHKTIKKTLKNN